MLILVIGRGQIASNEQTLLIGLSERAARQVLIEFAVVLERRRRRRRRLLGDERIAGALVARRVEDGRVLALLEVEEKRRDDAERGHLVAVTAGVEKARPLAEIAAVVLGTLGRDAVATQSALHPR